MSFSREIANGVGAQMMRIALVFAAALVALGFVLGWMVFG